MSDNENNLKEHLIEKKPTTLSESFLEMTDEDDRTDEEKSKFAFVYERIERWKNLYYRLTQGSTSGSVFCLLCLTFGSGNDIYFKN
jgi:hypothetical protein